MQRVTIPATTNGGGTVTAKSENLTGRIHSISYIKGDFADGVDFTVTLEKTGQSIWAQADRNASQTVYPRVAASKADGTASTLTEVPVVVINDRIVFAVAQGGAAKSGSFEVVLD